MFLGVAAALTLIVALAYVFRPALPPHQGVAAAAEFQKILNHSGIALNEPIAPRPISALAAPTRSPVTAGKARSKYQDFLELWKDADPDTPILKQAKREYAKLQ